jgi:hypothetical protein
MRAAIARQKQREAEAAIAQAVAGEAGEPLAKQKKRTEAELASRPNLPAAPKPKTPRPKRDAKSRDERVAPVVKRLPHGAEIHKRWNAVTMRWETMLLVPKVGAVPDWAICHEAPNGQLIVQFQPTSGEVTVHHGESDGSFRGEEEVFQMYLKSLGEAK